MEVNVKITSEAIEKPGEMAVILNNLQEGDVLFVDEIHRLNRQVEEVLYPAMEDYVIDIMIGKGAGARSIRLDLPHFTLVGATTRAGMLTAPLRDRFGVVQRLNFIRRKNCGQSSCGLRLYSGWRLTQEVHSSLQSAHGGHRALQTVC